MSYEHFVYKYVLNDEIIYICKNDTNSHLPITQYGNRKDDIPQHVLEDINTADVYYIKLANRIMSDVVEKELIRIYKPKYNKDEITSEWSGLPFAEPEWKQYTPKIEEKTCKNTKILKNKVEKALKKNNSAKRSLQNLLYILADESNIITKDNSNNKNNHDEDFKTYIVMDYFSSRINRRLVKKDFVRIVTEKNSFSKSLSLLSCTKIKTESIPLIDIALVKSKLSYSDLRNEAKLMLRMIDRYEKYAKENFLV